MVGEDEAEGPDDVGGDGPEDLAFEEGFADQAELAVFEVSEAAVDEFGGGGRGAGGEVFGFAEVDGPASAGGVAGYGATVDAAADDGDVVGVCGFEGHAVTEVSDNVFERMEDT